MTRLTGLTAVRPPADILPAALLPANHRHSSKSNAWTTPPYIIEPARVVLGNIDLDPASSAWSNRIVKADFYYTRRDDGLKKPWRVAQRYKGGRRAPTSIWLNPPGGWHNGRVGDSEVKHWWLKTLSEWREPYFGHMLFLAFSIEALQTTQVDCEYSLCDFPTVIFDRRVSYVDPSTGKTWQGNTHASSITYIPGRLKRTRLFFETFSRLGKPMGPINWKGMAA